MKLEEMVARAAAETEDMARAEKEGRKAAADKTLPVPPVPSGKPSNYGVHRRVAAQEGSHRLGPELESGGEGETVSGPDIVPARRLFQRSRFYARRHVVMALRSYHAESKDKRKAAWTPSSAASRKKSARARLPRYMLPMCAASWS